MGVPWGSHGVPTDYCYIDIATWDHLGHWNYPKMPQVFSGIKGDLAAGDVAMMGRPPKVSRMTRSAGVNQVMSHNLELVWETPSCLGNCGLVT